MQSYDRYPKPAIYGMHNLHGQFDGFHSLIFCLNDFKEARCLNLSGNMVHIFGPRCAREFVPYETVRTLRDRKIFPVGYLRDFLKGRTSSIIFGDIPLATL